MIRKSVLNYGENMFVRNGGIIIIIIISKTALFEPQLDFGFFTQQSSQPCVEPPTYTTRSLYLYPPVTGWPTYTTQTPDSLVLTFYDS
jgi:hypothetical protein